MKPFFSESDCDRPKFNSGHISIDKANQLIKERARVVYKPDREIEGLFWTAEPSKYDKHTHQALLICVEPIERDSAEKFVSEFAHAVEAKKPFYFDEWADRAKKLLEQK